MTRKNAIVTGSSSGFGLLCVLELAKSGFHVIATMRDISKADKLFEEARKQNSEPFIEVQPLDVTSSESISQFTSYLSNLNSVDILVNNAGIAIGGFCEELSIDDYRQQFDTNFFAVVAITQAVLPFMRKSGGGRMINMSSISGQFGFPGLSPYAASKHALEGFSESLRLEVKPFGIDVVLIEPGSYKTNIWTSMDQISISENSPYHSYMVKLQTEIESEKANHGSPEEVAALVAQVASQEKTPKLRYPIGKSVKTNIRLKAFLPWQFIESLIFKKLR
ncbi:SDR family oxidoreductase [Bacillus sp. B15-48]|uniref:SDR family oxidoreductase n=1 Tax=Bacillus sp. B15-48 TaxID=1548601 RepID=UPI00193FFBFF|nr:SDR family oxidoreductase [Bacillus sp. B15-48]MBM4763405.1 SDR family oxidoreductase [Bacillus sp. B15-48]